MSDLSHDSPGVHGLAQLGRNAIKRVSELERDIAERDETIRQLNKEIDDLIKTDNETIRSFFAEQAKRDETIRQLRARLDEYKRAPVMAWLATQQQHNPSQCVVTTKMDGWDHVELIARPTRKDGE